jgi:predicted site-specific integrase-resolvase
MKREKPTMISTTDFAKKMQVNYRTALNWLRAGRVPGAVEQKLPNGIVYWEIPTTALAMQKPKPGPKKAAKKGTK